MNLGEKVRYIRKTNDLNQKEFSIEIGVSQGTLSDIERGVCLPSCETLAALRARFNCDLNWLLAENAEKAASTQTNISMDELNLLESIRLLPVREKDELLEIVHIKLKKNKYPITD